MDPLAIGVCTGSLAAEAPAQVFDACADLGVEIVQLSGMPGSFGRRNPRYVVEEAVSAGVEIVSCSITHKGEDYTTLETIRETGGFLKEWKKRLHNVQKAADWMAEAEIFHATTHVGHIPDDPSDPHWSVLIERVQDVADELRQRRIFLAMETGQETAETLERFLAELERDNVGVNFDPANMVLYGKGDPVAALDVLGGRVVSVHCKDAVYSRRPGQDWGLEVPFGKGQINAHAWLQKLFALGYRGPLVIEREGGEQRREDIAEAIRILRAERMLVLPPEPEVVPAESAAAATVEPAAPQLGEAGTPGA